MSDDDPFGNLPGAGTNKTRVRPLPGGRKRYPSQSPGAQSPVYSATATLPESHSKANPLLASAFTLLTLTTQLRSSVSCGDINALRDRLIGEIKNYEQDSYKKGILPDQVDSGRYALCAFIDDLILTTPWGSQSNWARESLLITFYQEGWGGETFFQRLEDLCKREATNLNAVELFYYCLSLGFQGKYRGVDGGSTYLEEVRLNLYLLICRQKKEQESDLSIHWQGIKGHRNGLMDHFPLWVVVAVTGGLLALTYLGFSYVANRESDLLSTQLSEMARKAPKVASTPVFRPKRTIDQELRERLAFDIAADALDVAETQEGTIVRISNLFPSGSIQIKSEHHALLRRVTSAVDAVSQNIIVAGHSDNIPILSARFPSNWHLSKSRAQAVADFINSIGLYRGQLKVEGRGDTAPLKNNDTKVNRALNRRVELIIR